MFTFLEKNDVNVGQEQVLAVDLFDEPYNIQTRFFGIPITELSDSYLGPDDDVL